MENTAKELVNYSSHIYNKILELKNNGYISDKDYKKHCENIRDIRVLLMASVVREDNKIDMIKDDAMGFLPLKKLYNEV